MKTEGGCFCGAVRYVFEEDAPLTANCHCTMCRRTSAAPFVTWTIVPVQKFSYTKGAPAVLHSSTIGVRHYCSACGTPLTCSISERPEHIDITTASIDQPESFVPTMEVHTDTKLPWLGPTMPC